MYASNLVATAGCLFLGWSGAVRLALTWRFQLAKFETASENFRVLKIRTSGQ